MPYSSTQRDHLDFPLFRVSEAAIVTDVDVGTLRSWIQRKYLVLKKYAQHPDRPAAVAGSRHLLSPRRVDQIGIAKALIDAVGMDPKPALHAALAFTDRGTGERQPGMAFPEGNMTLLIVSKSKSRVVKYNPHRNFPFEEILEHGSAFAVVNVNDVMAAIDQRHMKILDKQASREVGVAE